MTSVGLSVINNAYYSILLGKVSEGWTWDNWRSCKSTPALCNKTTSFWSHEPAQTELRCLLSTWWPSFITWRSF